MPTKLTRHNVDGITLLRLTGELTHQGVPAIQPAFEEATPASARVVVDLTGVSMVTTPGLSLLLGAARRLRESGGRFVLAGAGEVVDEVFHRCRLESVLTVVSDAAEATRLARED